MSFLFFFNTVVASDLATFNLGSFILSSSILSSFNSLNLNNLDDFNLGASNLGASNSASSILVDFTLVNSSFAGFYLVGSHFDNKLLFANAGFFSNTSSHLASRFFLQGPGSLLFTGYSFNYYVRLSLLLSYFKPHHFSCQVHFADNLPGFRRILSLSNLAMSGFSNSYLHHYISFVPSLQLHYSFGHNRFVSHTLQSPCLQLDPLASACLPSFSLPDQVTIPSNLPSLSSHVDASKGGIFFQFSLPKLRLSSFPFALYISRPSSLVPTLSDSHPLEPFDFNRSFYSQNLPSYVGFLDSSLPSCNFNSTYPSVEPIKSVGDSTSSISDFTSISDPLSTCDIASFHHFLNLRSRTASFFSFLDSFFLIDSPFLDSLPWDSFSFKQNPFCFPSLPSLLHTSSADFSPFDNELFLANNSFYPFGKEQSCLYEEQFSLQQDLFHLFNHKCSSYKEHFPLNQAHFLLGEEHFLSNNSIFTSNISFPSTSFHLLQHCSTFLASFFHASTFKANFKVSFKPTFKPYHFLSVNFGNFASSPNFDNFFSFSHSTHLDIYHHLDKSYCCPSANLHSPHFHNASILSDYFCNLSHLAMQNDVSNNIDFSNLSNLTMQNCVTFGDYFCNLTNLATHNYVFSSHYFCKSSNLTMQNCVIFNNYFYNLSNLVMHNDVISSHYFNNLSNLMVQNDVIFSHYFNNYSCNFVHLLTSNSVTLQHYSNYFSDFVHTNSVILQNYTGHFVNFVRPNCVTLQHYACNFVDLVHTNNFIFNYYFYNLSYFVMHNDVIFSDYFCNLSISKLHNNVILSNYCCNLSSLAMYNNVTFCIYFYNLTNLLLQYNITFCNYFHNLSSFTTQNNVTFNHYFCYLTHLQMQISPTFCSYFCNLTFSKLHNSIFLSNHFSTLSPFSSCNNVFLSTYFCNLTYFTSLKSCSNQANLYNRSSYLSDFLAKYSVYSLHSPSLKTLLHKHTRSFYSSKLTKTSNNLSKKASSLRSHYRIKMSFEDKIDSKFAISLAKDYLLEQFPSAILFAACHQNTNHTHIHVLLFARDLDGKKLHFSNSSYKKLDIGWAKLYARVFGEHKLEQHIHKKALSRQWKKDMAMGVKRDKPYRVSVNSRQDHSKSYDNPSNLFDLQYPVEHLAASFIDKNVPFLTKNLSFTDINAPFQTKNISIIDRNSLLIDKNIDKNIVFDATNISIFDINAGRNLSFNSTYLHNIDRNDRLSFSFPSDKDTFIADKHLIFSSDKLSFSNKQQPLFDKDLVFSTKQPDFFDNKHVFFHTFSDHKHVFFDSFLDKQLDVSDHKLSFCDNKPLEFATYSHSNAVLDNKEHLHLQPSINFFVDNNQHFSDHKLPFWDNKPLEFATCSSFNAVLDIKEHLQLQPSINFFDNFADKNFPFNCSIVDKTSISHSSFLDKDFVSNELVVDKVPVSHSTFLDKDFSHNSTFVDKDLVSNNVFVDKVVDKDSLSNRPHFDKVPLIDNALAHHRPSHNLIHHHDPTLNQTHNSFSYHNYQELIDNFETDYFRCVAEREIAERKLNENDRDFADRELVDRELVDRKFVDRELVDGDFDHAGIETDRDFDAPDR